MNIDTFRFTIIFVNLSLPLDVLLWHKGCCVQFNVTRGTIDHIYLPNSRVGEVDCYSPLLCTTSAILFQLVLGTTFSPHLFFPILLYRKPNFCDGSCHYDVTKSQTMEMSVLYLALMFKGESLWYQNKHYDAYGGCY